MSGAKIFWTVIGAILGISIVVFGINWFNAGKDIVSPANVKEQQQFVIGHYNDMITASSNVCTVQSSQAKSNNTGTAPVLVESPVLAYEATFRNIRANYNSAVDNLFKAKIVMPAGYPSSDQLNALDTTNWCTVPTKLMEMRR